MRSRLPHTVFLVVTLWVMMSGSQLAQGEVYGPPNLSLSGLAREVASPFGPRLSTASLPRGGVSFEPARPSLLFSNRDGEDDSTIERASGEDQGPHVPEPMLFDLVRPLGAKRGEREVNVLGLASLTRRTTTRTDDVPDPLNVARLGVGVEGLEWAPEIEYAVLDGIAVELELPLNNLHVEAYKAGAQITFGTAFKNHLIHGAQMLIQYDIQPRVWTPTLLYLIGVRLDHIWSFMGMFGARGDLHPGSRPDQMELLSNVTVFADLTSRLVGGLETNFAQQISGRSSLLVMPQVHYEVSQRWMAQVGVGTRIAGDVVLPEVGFRLIREF